MQEVGPALVERSLLHRFASPGVAQELVNEWLLAPKSRQQGDIDVSRYSRLSPPLYRNPTNEAGFPALCIAKPL